MTDEERARLTREIEWQAIEQSAQQERYERIKGPFPVQTPLLDMRSLTIDESINHFKRSLADRHINTNIRIYVQQPTKVTSEDGAILVIPELDRCLRAMHDAVLNYARAHGVPFWEVGVAIETDTSNPVHLGITFRAYHKPRQGPNE